MQRRIAIIMLLLTFLSSVICTSPPSFCKCTCFTNSTIIPLNTPPSSDNPSSSSPLTTTSTTPFSLLTLRTLFHPILPQRRAPTKESPQRTCADCNRQFCLDYNLPICKDVKLDTDVVATCFQRDSVKDEVVVFLFVGATVGLLGWAIVRPWVGEWFEKIQGGHGYDVLAR